MKETVLDVLMYLFEHYVDEDNEFEPDREALQSHLSDAGFGDVEIDKAFDWLEGLSAQEPDLQGYNPAALRQYSEHELDRLNSESRGFLLFLEQQGVLNATTRELVIDRVMALDGDDVDLEQLKWVVLMVLFNQPDQEAAFTWLEDLVLQDPPPYLH
ncbi:MAG: DUF494 domain-containing protein [Thiohalocapsa sp.]|jgi:Smg protein